MKSFKKAIALLMIVATLMSLPVSASAEWSWKRNKKEETTVSAEAETAADATEAVAVEETTRKKFKLFKKAEEKAAPAAETVVATEAETKKVNKREKVATMYLLFTSANKLEPHFWVYIVNNTDETLMVGPYAIEPHGSVSIGSWDDRGMGKGIHFNLERYWVKEETYGRAFSISTSVTRGELERVGKKFKYHNYWNWGFNCVWFATSMWNTCTVKFVPFLFSPRFSLAFMFLYGAKRPDYTIQKLNKASGCYKYQKDGTLKPVIPGVLFTNYGV